MTSDGGIGEVSMRVLQVVPAHPDTWVATVSESAIGGVVGAAGWQATTVTSYEIAVDPVDCWALVHIEGDGGPVRQQLLPVCQSWMLTAQHDSPLADLVTSADFTRSATFQGDTRQLRQPVVVRASTAEEARKLVQQRVPPSAHVSS
jgi:hypothetical protein